MARRKKERSDVQFDFRRPRRSSESIMDFASDGKNPNKGRLSPQEYLAAWKAFKEDKAGCPHIYQPLLVENAQRMGSKVATCGRGKSQPSAWDEKQLGQWHSSQNKDGSLSKGDVLEEPRMHHLSDLRKVVDKDALMVFDGFGTFVVGTDTASAIHCIHSHKTGNYAAVVTCLKRLAFDESQVANLVGRFNEDIVAEIVENGGFLTWNSYQVVTWGYLIRNDKQLSTAQIRKIKNVDDVEFEPLDEPIVGNNVSQDELSQAVRELMLNITRPDGSNAWANFCGNDEGDWAKHACSGYAKIRTNIGTLCRNSPTVLNCFGLKNCQMGLPIFKRWVGDTAKDSKEVVSMAVGMRLTVDVAENKWEMMTRFRDATPTTTEEIIPQEAVDIEEVNVAEQEKLSPAAIVAEEDE